MSEMPKTIISDTSCFIVLTNINEMNLLQKVYGNVITTEIIAAEFGQPLPEWVKIRQVNDKNLQRVLEMQIDKGEASAIALAIETPYSTVIIDDQKARKIAERLGMNITGTIGVIIKAKERGIIPAIRPYIEKIRSTTFHLSEEIELKALKMAGE
jgi:predicted nucleic acid-binding protein